MLIMQLGFAQRNFIDGTIIQKDGKEVFGQIDYQNWAVSPKKILFKAIDASVKALSPKDIKGFVIKNNSEKYLSAAVELNNEPVTSGKLKEFDSTKEALDKQEIVSDTVFLLTLATGTLNLYSLVDEERKEHYFVKKNDAPIKELIYRKVIINNKGDKKILEIKGHIFQLKNDVLDCPDVHESLESVRYSEPDLKKIVVDYNNCKGKNTYTKAADIKPIVLYALAGISTSATKYVGDMLKQNINGQLTPTLGLGVDISLGRDRNKWGTGFELVYKSIKSSAENQHDNGIYTAKYKYNFDMTFIQLNTFFRYVFYVGKVQPYIKGGFGLAKINKSNNSVIETDNISSNSTTTKIETKKSELNINAALGARMGKLFLEGRLDYGLNISSYVVQSVQSKYFNLILGYSFF